MKLKNRKKEISVIDSSHIWFENVINDLVDFRIIFRNKKYSVGDICVLRKCYFYPDDITVQTKETLIIEFISIEPVNENNILATFKKLYHCKGLSVV